MELMSRVERHKVRQSNGPVFLPIIVIGLLYAVMLYFLVRYLHIPESLQFRQSLQLSLFFFSILFLELYLLAFIFVSTKQFAHPDNKVTRVNLYIVILWVLSLLYHFILWLSNGSLLPHYYYYAGLSITWGAFLVTLLHFFLYFSYVRRDLRAHSKINEMDKRRQAYEVMKRILLMYQIVHELMNKDAEVRQMLRWNHFDDKMERMVSEIEPYIHAPSFTNEELQHLFGVKAWMDNLLMIIEQHPSHHGLYKKIEA